jgi:hypothetical protein
MELLSVGQAADLLEVDESRIRQLLQAGQLQGRHLGGRWLVEGDSVRERRDRRPASGRPLSERNAWGLLALLADRPPAGLSAPEHSRLVARLRILAAQDDLAGAKLQGLLRARAELRRYRAHRGVLDALLADPDVVRAGVSAAPRAGADYVAPEQAEVYVRPDRVHRLEAHYGLLRDHERGNLLVRIPPAEAWPVLQTSRAAAVGGSDAPAAVIAADLLDRPDDRAHAAAAALLRPSFDHWSSAKPGRPQ